MRSFLQTLNYTSSNEDSRSEIRALAIESRDAVLCITGSGARPLDLLIAGPAVIVSIDLNPCQSFLLELKMAAIRCLEHEDFLGFLGIYPSQRRERVYQRMRQYLSPEAKGFWDRRTRLIAKGVIYQGRWERHFRRVACGLNLVRPSLRDRLFDSRDVSEQAEVWHEEARKPFLGMLLQVLSSRSLSRRAFGDPGFYRYVSDDFSVSRYLTERLSNALENILLRESAYATLLLFGRYSATRQLPLYLQRSHYGTLKDRLGSVEVTTASLLDYLRTCKANRFQKYSLSDFASYTDEEERAMIWKEIVRTAATGARVCERQVLVKRELPSAVRPFVRRIESLEKELEKTDDSIFYTFVIGQIQGDGHA
jgi:S-adenosylmethionine-diacylglycerol 3-amino-3-carboxypropyl transferase